MLSKKLKLSPINSINNENYCPAENSAGEKENTMASKHFVAAPFWKMFFDLELALNKELAKLKFDSRITHIYNPIEYASDLHCAYLKKYLTGPKALMLVGMNPGPNGMVQTGVPFGNIQTVRDWMLLDGDVEQPEKVHSKRPVVGLKCEIEEPSGVRFWTVLKEISTDLDIYAQNCFMHNFCPLAFFDNQGRNITPSELKQPSKKELQTVCLKYLQEKIDLIKPQKVVAVGSYVGECLKQLEKQENYKESTIQFLKLPHPSPRSLNNNNWPEKARNFFKDHDLMKYIKNQI